MKQKSFTKVLNLAFSCPLCVTAVLVIYDPSFFTCMSTLMLDNRTQGFENALWRAVTTKKKGQSFTTSVEVIDR